MQVGIIRHNNLNQTKATTFQGGYTKAAQFKAAVEVADGEKTFSPERLTQIIRLLVANLEGHPLVKKVRFGEDITKGVLADATRILKPRTRASIEEKKAAVSAVFALAGNDSALDSKVVGNYITQKLIPRIVDSSDRELAEHTLNLLPKANEESKDLCGLLLNRIDLINVTQDQKYISELHGYTGDQYGLPDYMRDNKGYDNDKAAIRDAADLVISVLSE